MRNRAAEERNGNSCFRADRDFNLVFGDFFFRFSFCFVFFLKFSKSTDAVLYHVAVVCLLLNASPKILKPLDMNQVSGCLFSTTLHTPHRTAHMIVSLFICMAMINHILRWK